VTNLGILPDDKAYMDRSMKRSLNKANVNKWESRKIQLGRHSHKWVDKTTKNRWGGMDWTDLALERCWENNYEPTSFLRSKGIFYYLSDWQLLEKGTAPRS
jgi:hypothetical protein